MRYDYIPPIKADNNLKRELNQYICRQLWQQNLLHGNEKNTTKEK